MSSQTPVSQFELEVLDSLLAEAGKEAGLPEPVTSAWTGASWEWRWATVNGDVVRELRVQASPFFTSDGKVDFVARAVTGDRRASGTPIHSGLPYLDVKHLLDVHPERRRVLIAKISGMLRDLWERVPEVSATAEAASEEDEIARFRQRFIS